MLNPTDSSKSDNRERPVLQPMGFTDILDGMFSLYRSHLRLFLSIVAVYLVFSFGINLSLFLLETARLSVTSMVIVGGFVALFSVAVSIFVVAGLAYASSHAYLGRAITPEAALQRASQRFWTYLGSSFLWLLVVGGLAITIVGIPFAIYFSVRWGLYSLPVLFEGSTARNALRRSTELVRGTWWRVFGITLAVLLLYLMIDFILEVSSGFLLSWIGVTEVEAPETPLETFRQLFVPMPGEVGWFSYTIRRLVTLSITALTMPISVIGSTLLYFDLRIRKEAFDIEMQVTD